MLRWRPYGSGVSASHAQRSTHPVYRRNRNDVHTEMRCSHILRDAFIPLSDAARRSVKTARVVVHCTSMQPLLQRCALIAAVALLASGLLQAAPATFWPGF